MIPDISTIKEIEKEITVKYGKLNLFALLEREDLKDKWDVLISVAISLDKKNELLNDIINRFKSKLQPIELLQISRFIYLEPSHGFVLNINRVAQIENSEVEIKNSTFNDVQIGHAIIISSAS